MLLNITHSLAEECSFLPDESAYNIVTRSCTNVTDTVLQVPSEALSAPTGIEPATSGFPSATTTNYAKEKQAI